VSTPLDTPCFTLTAPRRAPAALLSFTGFVFRYCLIPACPCSAENGCFQHASGDIRGATEALFTSVAKVTGPAILSQLTPHLRPKQVAEYTAAFAAGGAPGGAGGPAAAKPSYGGGYGEAPSHARAGAGAGGKPAGGAAAAGQRKAGGGVASPAPAARGAGAGGAAGGAEEAGDGACQFCGGCGPHATEQQLDLHYFRDCPLLTTCAACSQVVEIATYSEHLLEECERKGEYEPCPNCAAAVRSQELDAHVKARACKPNPDPAAHPRCPLCQADIGDDKDAWTHHLLGAGCPRNPRTNRAKGGIGFKK